MNKIVTIGREFGSGGRELGRKLAEKLGFEYYDNEIVTQIAERTALSEQYVREVIERSPHELFPITVGHSFTYISSYALDKKQAVFREKENVLKKMAETSNCVIVGRCADYILKDYKPFKIFVYANMPSKIARCRERNNGAVELNDKKIKKYIKEIDRHRASYYNFFTGQEWGDKLYYDVCVNTTSTPINDIVEYLAKALQ